MHLAEHVGYTFATSKESNRRQPIFETAGAPQLGSGDRIKFSSMVSSTRSIPILQAWFDGGNLAWRVGYTFPLYACKPLARPLF